MKHILFGLLNEDMRAVVKNFPYEINYIITNGNGQNDFEGIRVFSSIKLFEEKEKVYIFITDLSNYVEYAKQLLAMGFIEGKDFAGANEYAYNQWENVEYFADTFTVRVFHMAGLISKDSVSVMDLGCGTQKLKNFIRSDIDYIGVDYTERDKSTVVCDFNKKEFPAYRVDTIFVSGCLEYIEDVEWFVEKISEHTKKELVLSYCPLEYVSDIRERRKIGWKNHMSMTQLNKVMQEVGLEITFGEKSIGSNVIFHYGKIPGGGIMNFQIFVMQIKLMLQINNFVRENRNILYA